MKRSGISASEAARALARLGASKGGKASAQALTAEERKARARKAIAKRWENARAKEAIEEQSTRGGDDK